jgi:hypothetical protein
VTGVVRLPNGQIAGGSLNPGGRRGVPSVLKEAGPNAAQMLIDLMEGKKTDERVSPAQAAIAILDRVYPKPAPDVGGGSDELIAFLLAVRANMRPAGQDDVDVIDGELADA